MPLPYITTIKSISMKYTLLLCHFLTLQQFLNKDIKMLSKTWLKLGLFLQLKEIEILKLLIN